MTGYEIVYKKEKKLSPQKSKSLLSKLTTIVGTDNVSEREIDRLACGKDFWPISSMWLAQGKIPALPDFVVWPESAEQISKILKLANEQLIPVIPFGEGSGVMGGAIPVQGGIVVDLKRMNKILKIDDKSLLVTVQPGLNGMNFERQLTSKGYTAGHFPQSLYASTIGGWLACRAAGQFSTKYGKIEDIVVALEAVLPRGEIIRSKTVPRSSTGPQVERLLLGAEGTLGIITQATLRIWPYPEKSVSRSFAFEDIKHAFGSVRNILRGNINPAVVRLYDQDETARHFYATPEAKDRCMLILVMEGAKELVDLEEKVSVEICKARGGIDSGQEPADHWFKTRFNVSESSKVPQFGLVFDTIEIAATWDRVENLYTRVIKAMKKVEGVMVASAHASHVYPQGACLYCTFAGMSPKGDKQEDFFCKVWDAVMQATLEAGGTISHHHGIGISRARWLPKELGASFEVLKRIKKTFDPNNIMNPGKLGL